MAAASQDMKKKKSIFSSSLLSAFFRASLAGLVAVIFNFLLRFGGFAPFPPESGIEAFLKIIPESIQEPAVQKFGELAGQLGLLGATVIAILVYGVLGVVFQRIVLPRLAKVKSLTVLEGFLSFSIVPWLLFGAVLLPLLGASFFGVASLFASSNSTWVFPISLLFVQLVFSFVLYYEYRAVGLVSRKAIMISSSSPIGTRFPQNNRGVEKVSPPATAKSVSRRMFIEKGVLAAGVIVLAVASLDGILTSLSSSTSTPASSSGTAIDLQSAPAIFSDPRLAPLVNAEVTPNDSFYRVAIDLFDPNVDASTWNLQLGGLLGNPKNYTLTSLENSFPQVNQYNTFECVSNVINGNLVGNAKWTGVRISDLLRDAGGVSQNGKYVVFYSVDGYSVGIPLSRAMMSDSMLAYKMNDQALPQKHGYPLRAVIPGLYGMMSAKWIDKIEVVDSVYQGYWQTRGWSNDGTVETVSFITIPGDGSSASLSANNGSVILGGTAYGGDRGISKVEVSTDGGKTWQDAQLKKGLASTTWALWAYDWRPAKTGSYNIYARATDGTNTLQASDQSGTFPNGATGYAMVGVRVTS